MRLIDADSLLDWGEYKLSDATKYGNKDAKQMSWSYSTMMMYEVADEIENAPTIDLIHAAGGCYCRECRYGIPLNDSEIRCDYHDFTAWPKDGFCSYGEPREERDDG